MNKNYLTNIKLYSRASKHMASVSVNEIIEVNTFIDKNNCNKTQIECTTSKFVGFVKSGEENLKELLCQRRIKLFDSSGMPHNIHFDYFKPVDNECYEFHITIERLVDNPFKASIKEI